MAETVTASVADVMTTDVEFIAPDASVAEAATLMGELEVGALPVGSAERLDGIVTDRDILYRAVSRGLDPTRVTAREVASSPVVTCRPEDPLGTAMDAMASQQVRRLAVVEDGRVVGWITLADISRRLLLDSRTLQSALHDLTEAPAERSPKPATSPKAGTPSQAP